jgi:hypothetical protein
MGVHRKVISLIQVLRSRTCRGEFVSGKVCIGFASGFISLSRMAQSQCLIHLYSLPSSSFRYSTQYHRRPGFKYPLPLLRRRGARVSSIGEAIFLSFSIRTQASDHKVSTGIMKRPVFYCLVVCHAHLSLENVMLIFLCCSFAYK